MADSQGPELIEDNFGAKSLLMTNRPAYPMTEEDETGRQPLTLRVSKEHHKALKMVAGLWNEFDKERGVKRDHKWKVSSVIERFVDVMLASLWEQMGGQPQVGETFEEFAARAKKAVLGEHTKKK